MGAGPRTRLGLGRAGGGGGEWCGLTARRVVRFPLAGPDLGGSAEPGGVWNPEARAAAHVAALGAGTERVACGALQERRASTERVDGEEEPCGDAGILRGAAAPT